MRDYTVGTVQNMICDMTSHYWLPLLLLLLRWRQICTSRKIEMMFDWKWVGWIERGVAWVVTGEQHQWSALSKYPRSTEVLCPGQRVCWLLGILDLIRCYPGSNDVCSPTPFIRLVCLGLFLLTTEDRLCDDFLIWGSIISVTRFQTTIELCGRISAAQPSFLQRVWVCLAVLL